MEGDAGLAKDAAPELSDGITLAMEEADVHDVSTRVRPLLEEMVSRGFISEGTAAAAIERTIGTDLNDPQSRRSLVYDIQRPITTDYRARFSEQAKQAAAELQEVVEQTCDGATVRITSSSGSRY
jgi:membrane peptidoglycan carboxypeptidase